jgi:hypothetical protein
MSLTVITSCPVCSSQKNLLLCDRDHQAPHRGAHASTCNKVKKSLETLDRAEQIYVPTLEMSSHLREEQHLKIMPVTFGVY